MKVIIADQFSPQGMEELKEAGVQLIYDKDLNGETLKTALETEKPEVLVVRSTKVPADIIDVNS